MSPIATVTRRVAAAEPAFNGSRPRPSILVLLQTTGTIESLAAMRATMLAEVAAGTIAPSAQTFRAWQDAIWVRVLELMALSPRSASYIFNTVLTWPKPWALHELLEEQLRICVEPLVSDAERLKLQGVEIEGVAS